MTLVVLDTNVLVSALLSPAGPSHQVVLLTLRGHLRIGFDSRILHEYREVLTRGRFRFPPRLVDDLLDSLLGGGEEVIPLPVSGSLPDEGDRPFLEVAVASGAEALITGNARHFKRAEKMGVRVISPGEFLRRWGRRRRQKGG